MNKPARMKIGLVGDDLLGVAMVMAWAEADHIPHAYSTVNEVVQERLDSLFPLMVNTDIQSLVEESDLILVSLNEDEIEATVSGLAQLGFLGRGKIVVHTAPEHGFGVLAMAAKFGSIPIVLQPLMLPTGNSMDIIAMRNAHCIVTAPEMVLPIAQGLALELGCEPIIVSESERTAFADTYMTLMESPDSMVKSAISYLQEADVDRAVDIVGSIAKVSLEKALRLRGYEFGSKDFLD